MTEESRTSEHGNDPGDAAADVKKNKMKEEEEEEMNDENEEEGLLDAPAGGIDVRRQSSAPQVGNSLSLISKTISFFGDAFRLCSL